MTTGIASTVFDTSLFIPELRYRKLEPVLGEMASRAERAGFVSGARDLRAALIWRERAGSTGINKGVAIPHARSIHILEPCMVFARSGPGVPWDAADGETVHLILLMLSPSEVTAEMHAEWVASAATILRGQRQRQRLRDADSFETVAAVLAEAGA